MSKSRIDQLIAAQTSVENAALKAALIEQQQREENAQKERLLNQFNVLTRVLNNNVQELQRIRKSEQRQLKFVKAIDAAVEQFKKDGDINKVKKALSKADFFSSDIINL